MQHLQKEFEWNNETTLKPGLFPDTGRGVYSTRQLKENETLIELPVNGLICMATIENDAAFRELFDRRALIPLEKKISIQSLLAFYLLFRRHRNVADAFIRTIPTAFSHPYFCNKAELLVLPDFLFERVLQQGQEITNSFALLSSALSDPYKCHYCDAADFNKCFNITDFKWAFFAVNSRSVYVEPATIKRLTRTHHMWQMLRDSANVALAPFLDLINHSDRIQCSKPELFVPIATTTKNQNATISNSIVYRLLCTRPFRAYEQIFISYGPLDNMRLLLEYGFIIADNCHDCVRLQWTDVTGYLDAFKRQHAPINSNKFKFIKENGLDAEMFVNRADGLSHNLLVVLTILFQPALAHFTNHLNQVGFGDSPPIAPIAQVARQLLQWKRAQFEIVANGLRRTTIDAENMSLSVCGSVCLEYVLECKRLIDDVLSEHLPEEAIEKHF